MRNNIIWRKEFIFPTSSRAIVNKERLYDIGQDKLPSVTTILAATQSEEKKASLEAWRQRLGAEAADKVKDDAAARGTVMHHIIESWLTDQGHLDLTDTGQQAHTMADLIIKKGLENRLTEIYGVEPTVFHSGMGYAGATDFIGVHDGELIIGDFKQSNKPKRREWIEDYKLQMAAYALAFQDMFNIPIGKAINFICTRDFYYQEFGFDGEEFRQAKYTWMKKVEQYYKEKVRHYD
jgi:ATP-dependent exoDNAse (exonuclease V) beta subunit